MAQRLYSVDDSLNLDWIDIDENDRHFDFKNIFFKVLNAKDGNTEFKFWMTWIYSEENPTGVWHKTPQSLAKQLRVKAREIQKTPVHPF